MMKNFFLTLLAIGHVTFQLGPLGIIRMMMVGHRKAMDIRYVHRREPTESEWRELSRQAYRQVTGRSISPE